MSKKIKAIILIAIMVILPKVKAVTPKIEYIDNVYSNRIVDGKSINGQLGYIYINDNLAFCIDPMKIIGKDYQPYVDKLDDYYTDEQQRKLKLIIHYGIELHKNNPYYYMATQELIWRLNNNGDFYFTKTSSINGEKINIDSYKEEILRNVKGHDIYPSFNQITITPKLYDTVLLKDENNVLEKFLYGNSNGNTVYKQGNELEIIISNMSPTTLKLHKTTMSGGISRTYIGDGQTLITSSLFDEQEATINIIPTGVSYYLGIKFKEGNDSIINKIKFKIYNHDTSNYILNGKIFESNNFGYFKSDFKINPGNYEIEYVDIPSPYIVSKLPNKFTLDENSEVDDEFRYQVVSYLEQPYGILKINRGVTKFDKSIYKLNNIEYDIYSYSNNYDNKSNLIYKKDQLVTTITTIDGYAEVKLPLGRYYVVERDNNYGVKKSAKQFATFKYVDSTTEYYISEKELISPLPRYDISINTYKENIDTTYSGYEYFKYDVVALDDVYYFNDLIYKKGEIVYKLKSDVNGYISKNFILPPGNYILIEDTFNDLYYESSNIEIINNVNNNSSNHEIYKKLKRGNLLVKIYSEIDNIPDELTFFYDSNLNYNIKNELLIENIKVGNYKLFYDKEYLVNIKDKETTILNITLLKKEEIKDNEKDNTNKEDKKEEIKDSKKDNTNKEDKKDEVKDNEKDNTNKEDKKEEIKDNEKDNTNKEDKKDEVKDNEKDNTNKEDKKDEVKDNEKDNTNKEDKKEEIKDNENNIVEKLPNTYNYLKQYCTLYEMFIISGLIIKLNAKKNK